MYSRLIVVLGTHVVKSSSCNIRAHIILAILYYSGVSYEHAFVVKSDMFDTELATQ